MPNSSHFYEPRLGHGLHHDPFNVIVEPRPIGWISTRNTQPAPRGPLLPCLRDSPNGALIVGIVSR